MSKYLAYILDPICRACLIEILPEIPLKWKQVCHHVTLFYDPPKEDLENLLIDFYRPKVEIIGKISDDKAIALICAVNGTTCRHEKFPGIYHITHALAPEVQPVHSNELLIKNTWVLFKKPIPIFGKVSLEGEDEE